MKKNINDYLHLYLGCKAEIINDEAKIIDYVTTSSLNDSLRLGITVKPILRPLSDMTDQEADEQENPELNDDIYIGGRWAIFNHQGTRTKWLLDKGFDLFELIDAGLAIDATALKK